ncbi:MAG TPA: class I SAM-dependent methyltransferase [Thermoanaerobaculia bacterium]|nr:class I SAM-dependent methyltransferase [Thermoanaerobaculia bacterium]
MSKSELLRQSWIANAEPWCDAVRNQRIESRRLVTDAAIVDAVLRDDPGHVLDLGCGEGWLARALHARGVTVTGVDASAPLVEAAHELGGGAFRALSYEEIIANPHALGAQFDTIVANFSLLDDRVEELLRALRNVLAPRGRLIVQTVHPSVALDDGAYADGWRTETFRSMPGTWPESMPWYFRTLASWVRLFGDAGYALTRIDEPRYPDRPAPASILFTLNLHSSS